MQPPLFRLHRGAGPLVLSVPHAGRALPALMRERLTISGNALIDTDWYVDELYDFAAAENVTTIVANYSRYVVDLNRPADDAPLYSGGNSQCLPLATFAGDALYLQNAQPTPTERAQRIATYWQPYHDALAGELARLHAQHGYVILLDGHSIAAVIPQLFSGRLSALNLGSNDGHSCSSTLGDRFAQWAIRSAYDHVCNGRFKGGYITRHYGRPNQGWHALQLEISQETYLAPASEALSLPARDSVRWARLQNQLRNLVDILNEARP